jgi:hypothetical protein
MKTFPEIEFYAPVVVKPRVDDKHCTTCLHETRVDFATCNQCSRDWGNTGRRTQWEAA